MRAIDAYLLKQLTVATLFITAGFTFAIWLTQSLRFIDYIVNKGLPVSSFLMLVGLMLPAFLSIILPIALFLATIFIYNKLSSDSEMVVLRAAGLSQWTLARPALMLAGVMTLLCYGLTLYVMPAAYGGFKSWQFEIRNYSGIVLQDGVFNTPMPGITVFVRDRTGEGMLEGLLIHDSRDPARPVTIMADSGTLVNTPEGPRVILVDGNRQQVETERDRLQLLNFDKWTLDLSGDHQTPGDRWRDTRERHLLELFDPPANTSDRVRRVFLAEAHQRLASPLYNLALTLVALAALFAGQFSRRGQIKLISTALLAGLLIQAGALGWQNLSAKIDGLWPSLYLNVLVPAGLAILVLAHPRKAERLLAWAGTPLARLIAAVSARLPKRANA